MREAWKLSKDAAVGFLGALSALAITGEEAVRRVSKEFANLYYMSQRTGVSAKGIEVFRFQFEKIGLSAEQAELGNIWPCVAYAESTRSYYPDTRLGRPDYR